MCVCGVYPQNVELHITFAGEHSSGMPPEVMQPRLDHGDLSPPSLFYLQLDVPPGNVLVPQSYLGNIRYSRYSLMSLQARGAPVHINPNTHTHTHIQARRTRGRWRDIFLRHSDSRHSTYFITAAFSFTQTLVRVILQTYCRQL